MSRYLLDTCALSELAKSRPDEGLLAWISQQAPDSLYVSVLSVAEIQQGLMKLEDNTAKKKRLSAWFSDLLKTKKDHILDINMEVAFKYGAIQATARAPRKLMPIIDALIAATALIHSMPVVTRNGPYMAASGVRLEDPWSRP